MGPSENMRIERTLLTLRAVWERNPDLRLCQLIGNVLGQGEDGYYLEHDELVRRLWRYGNALEARR